MAICPFCHTEKNLMARYCHACNRLVGMRYQLMTELFRGAVMIAGWTVLGFILYWLIWA